MIDKILKSKKYIIILISTMSLAVIVLLILLFQNGRQQLINYSNSNFKLKYDNTWKIKTKSDTEIELTHNTKSKVTISIVELDNKYRDSDIIQLLEEIRYSIEEQNKGYKKIIEEPINVSSNKYEGYKILYEDENNQAIVTVGKKNDKLFIINYTAENKYFDILLDSVQNIIWNFKTVDKDITISSNIKEIETSKIEYSTNDDFKCDYDQLNEYEIFSNHYNVKYNVPKCIEITDFNSKYGYYNVISNDNKKIKINTEVVYKNMYEYITDDTAFSSLATDIKNIKNNDLYTEVKVTNEKLDSKYESYVYKINYKASKSDVTYEKIYLIFSLDYLRTFVAVLDTSNATIPEKLVKALTDIKFTKYGDYIIRNANNGMITDNMKTFLSNITSKQYYDITYSIPEKYMEYDYENNKYINRYFKLDDKYQIELYLSNYYTIDKYIENIKESNKTKTNYKLSYVKKITNNNVVFHYYISNYSEAINNNSYQYKEVYLISELDAGGIYVVKIKAENTNISTDMINDFTIINIQKKI